MILIHLFKGKVRSQLRYLLRRAYYAGRAFVTKKFNLHTEIHRMVILESNSWSDIKGVLKSFYSVTRYVPTIRIGGISDGGYCVPNSLEDVEAFFSPGYGNLKLFEDELANRNITSYICDGSFTGVKDLKKNQFFTPKNLASFEDEESITLNTWVTSSEEIASRNLGLQMDIEGAEYEVLKSISSEFLKCFKIMLIEFHDLDSIIVSKNELVEKKNVIEKILLTHDLVHTKSNNAAGVVNFNGYQLPRVIELSFLRKESVIGKGGSIHEECPYLNNEQGILIPLPKLV